MAGIVYADVQPGATADAQIASAFALLPSGGIVNCENYVGKQTIASTVTIPANILVRCNPASKFQPATPTLDMFVLLPDAKLENVSVDTGNQPAYSGKVITVAPGSEDLNHIWLHNAHIVSAFVYPNPPTTQGTAIYIAAPGPGGQNTSYFSCTNVHIQGFRNGIHLWATGTRPGYVNGNLFQDITISYSVNGIFCETVNGGEINGNSFSNYQYESGGPGTVGIRMEGNSAGSVAQNTFSGIRIFDTDISMVLGDYARFNLFIGDVDGIPVDFPMMNNYIMAEGGHFIYSVMVFFVGLYRWLKSKL